jgi:hypothetical protein
MTRVHDQDKSDCNLIYIALNDHKFFKNLSKQSFKN